VIAGEMMAWFPLDLYPFHRSKPDSPYLVLFYIREIPGFAEELYLVGYCAKEDDRIRCYTWSGKVVLPSHWMHLPTPPDEFIIRKNDP